MKRFLILLVLGSCAQAHDPGLSSMTVDLTSKEVLVQAIFAGADLGGTSISEDRAARSAQLHVAEKGIPPRQVEVRTAGTDVELTLHFPRPASETTLRSALLAELPFGHRQALTVRDLAGNTVLTEVLSADRNSTSLPTAGPNAQLAWKPSPRAIVFGSVIAVAVAALAVWIRRRSNSAAG